MKPSTQPDTKSIWWSRKLGPFALATVLVILSIVVWMVTWKADNTVLIDNVGDQPISDVVVVVNGDKVILSSLPGHSSQLVKLKVKGESGIDLTFRNYSGRQCSEHVGVYIEGGTGRDVHLSIDSESKIRVLSVK